MKAYNLVLSRFFRLPSLSAVRGTAHRESTDSLIPTLVARCVITALDACWYRQLSYCEGQQLLTVCRWCYVVAFILPANVVCVINIYSGSTSGPISLQSLPDEVISQANYFLQKYSVVGMSRERDRTMYQTLWRHGNCHPAHMHCSKCKQMALKVH